LKVAWTVATVFNRQLMDINTEEAGCFEECMVLLTKKDFFPGEVCPLYFSEKYCISKSKHIHRKVKCADLVPEPGNR